MTADKLTVRLTNDQQKQIREATGKKVTALNIDLMGADQLSQSDLDSVSGGRKSAGGTATGSTFLRFKFE
ncbi:MAG TPA: hypothetical protein VGP62_24775 [Bryobacteraceae bacterium]|jgi:hypothetical protein|nr:hypothetical protein [Bryobacteraceae bacterium]